MENKGNYIPKKEKVIYVQPINATDHWGKVHYVKTEYSFYVNGDEVMRTDSIKLQRKGNGKGLTMFKKMVKEKGHDLNEVRVHRFSIKHLGFKC